MSDVDRVIAGAAAVSAELERQRSNDPRLYILKGVDSEAIVRAVLDALSMTTSLDQPSPTVGAESESVHDHLIDWMETSGFLNGQRTVMPRLIELIRERRDFGLRKYGTVLHANNSRDTLADILAECVDALAYMQVGVERSIGQRDRQWYETRRLRLTTLVCDTIALMSGAS